MNSKEASVPFLQDVEKESCEEVRDSKSLIGLKSYQGQTIEWRSLLYFIPLLFLTNIFTFYFTNRSWTENVDNLCALHTSQSWTPVFRDVDITYTTNTFNGTFFKETIYRQDPSLEVDAAWRDLGIEYTSMLVTPEDAEKSNIALDRLKLDERYGGPGYPAVFEVMHQLHCLDMLRKSSYYNYEYYVNEGKGAFKHPGKQLKSHMGHCLESIRQQLMCTADTGLHPFLWAGNPPHIFPEFNREHKCKNFEDIRKYAEKNQGTFDELDIVPEPGALVLPEIP